MTLRLNGSTSGYTEIDAPASAGNNTLLLPTGNGTSGQFLRTDGSGNLSWAGAGKVIQVVNSQTSAVASGVSTIPIDDTIPQITEGTEFLTASITPSSATSLLFIQARLLLASDGTVSITAALFQGATANALAATADFTNNDTLLALNLEHVMTAGTTSATTFRIRAGGSVSTTTTLNGVGGTRRFGGVASSGIVITEIAA